MKRFFLMLLIGLSYCISYSHNNDTLKVHQGTYIQSFPLSSIDSITHDGGQFVRIYHNEQMSSYSVNSVDSIVIRPATGACYQIPEEQLNGWDDGVYYTDMVNENNSFYIVSHSDPEDGTRTVYLDNFSNDDITQSMALVFSSNNEIHDIFLAGYQFEAFPKEESVTFIAYDKEGKAIDSFDVPYEYDSNKVSVRANSTRSIEHYRIVNTRIFLGKAGKTIWNVADIGRKLENGNYADILKDYLIGKLLGRVVKHFLYELILAEKIDAYLKQLYENNKNWFMGSAGIEITSIKRASKSTINVEGEISNISTIPSTRLVASEYPNYIGDMKEVPNYVKYGVAEGKSGQPGLYLHDKCTTPVVVSGSHFSCSLPVEYKPGQTFYFRPFLVPASQFEESADFGQAVGKMIASNVRYGSRKEFTDQTPTCSTGEVVSKSAKSAIVKCSYNGAEGFECGVMVSSDSGTKKYPTSSENGERIINLTDLSPSTTYNYWAYIDIADEPINGAVMSFTTDELVPPLEYGETSCPDSNHPHWIDLGLPSGTQWRCCNEGASTPEAYGGYYTFGQVSSAPTKEQILELLGYCSSVWTTLNGVNGIKFTGPNGGTIFLPAAGDRWDGEFAYVGSYGAFWSSTPFDEFGAYVLDFGSYGASWGSHDRITGHSVRPVR